MRLLYPIQRYYPYQGGSELICQLLAEDMAAAGHAVSVWTTDAWDLDHFWASGRRTITEPAAQHNGVAIRRFPVQRLPGPPVVYPLIRRLMVELGRLPATAPLLRRMATLTPRLPALTPALCALPQPPDIVHMANITLDFMLLPVARFARERRIPQVITPYVHLGEPGDPSLVRYYAMPHQIALLKQADRVTVQTGLEEDFLAARGVPRAIMRRIGVGIRPEAVTGGDAARFRATTGITAPIVLSIGTLARDKGTLDVVSAMAALWQRGCTADLVLVGSPMAQFEAAWEQLPAVVRKRTHVLARAPEQLKQDALAAASVFTLPSRTDSFGIVYLEAWLYGLPVIGARAGGVPDVISDGEDGFLVPFGAVSALAERIEQLLQEPATAERLGAAGRAKTLASLSWSQTLQRYQELYAEISPSAA